MEQIRDAVVGHPGLAPLIWWVIGFVVAAQSLMVIGALIRYWRRHPQTLEAKSVILLPLAGNVCLSSGLLFMVLMLHLMLIGQASFFCVLAGVLVGVIGILVHLMLPS